MGIESWMLINEEQHLGGKYRPDHSFNKDKQSLYAGGTK